MTPGSVDGELLVLGLGNPLLGDDGVGLALLEELAAAPDPGVEYLDGGTQGLALLGRIARRRALLIVDAVKTGAAPGTVHALRGAAAMEWLRGGATTAHESNAGELLAAAALLGMAPAEIAIVGVEPERLEIGMGLTDAVRRALPQAVARARDAIAEMAGEAEAPAAEAPAARAPEARAPEARAPEARAPEARAPEAVLRPAGPGAMLVDERGMI